MILVKNKKKYWDFIRELRNDNEIQSGFVEQVNITKAEQIKYMKKWGNHYYICLGENNCPVGYIGEIDRDIRLAVLKEYQKKGIGKFMLNKFMDINPYCSAKIKHGNISSIHLFESCGFDLSGSDVNFLYYKKNVI